MSLENGITLTREQWEAVAKQWDLSAKAMQHGEVIDNRRYALDRALQFYKNSVQGLVVAEAPVHLAAVYFDYVQHGKLPDSAEVAESARDAAENLVRMAIPHSARPEES